MLPVSRYLLLFFLPIFHIFDKFTYKGITIISNAREAAKTHHKEASFIFSVLALVVLSLWGSSQTLPVVTAINLLVSIDILSSTFNVVCHVNVLAHRLGKSYDSLILSPSAVTLEVSLASALTATGDVAPTLMRDALYSIIMVATGRLAGFSSLLGGRKFATQYMNLSSTKQYSAALFPLAIIVPVSPVVLSTTNFSTGQALPAALVSAAMHGVFLLTQTKMHQSSLVYEYEDDSDGDGLHHGKPSAYSGLWHAIWLAIHLTTVTTVTKMNASSLEMLLDSMNAPVALTGSPVALLILSPKGLSVLKAVLNNQVQRATNLFFGSVLTTISLTVSVVTLVVFMVGSELQSALGAPEMVVMVTPLVLCHIPFSIGRTNVSNGAAHLALFTAYLMTISAW